MRTILPASTDTSADGETRSEPGGTDNPGAVVPKPTWEERWRELVLGSDGGIGATAARAGLWGLSLLYGGIIGAYRAAYDLRLLRTVTAGCGVIGVGNLTVGGTGKSTTVRWLARCFRERGTSVAVLSYGYRAGSEAAVTVVSDCHQVLVPEAVSGDEPRMLAEALPGVPVLIGKRRQLSAREATRRFGTRVCVLDDAFQYWRLRKDLEVVLIDAGCPFGGGYLLPRGLLREHPRQLKRADIIIITNGQWITAAEREALAAELRRWNRRAPLAWARHAAAQLRILRQTGREAMVLGEDWATELLAGGVAALGGRRVLALSSLGNPGGFERLLVELGTEVVPARYPDHHHYQRNELEAEVNRARAAGCEAIVTTEKDAVKLGFDWKATLPVWVLVVELTFDQGQAEIEARLEALLAEQPWA